MLKARWLMTQIWIFCATLFREGLYVPTIDEIDRAWDDAGLETWRRIEWSRHERGGR